MVGTSHETPDSIEHDAGGPLSAWNPGQTVQEDPAIPVRSDPSVQQQDGSCVLLGTNETAEALTIPLSVVAAAFCLKG